MLKRLKALPTQYAKETTVSKPAVSLATNEALTCPGGETARVNEEEISGH